ncbi:MAG: hypothetical protein A2653_02670 [Candidatus Zambryskibacteria bacterium RIFCSPHIGHO2_01_FULL_43_25]|uniref:Uncharacterized protein n=1 Tax=Candidatus Zambryskibacteria bacterium RIFCSPLOWO2_01_FULL_45_21 TaxID=1802761 RepID=A0A1G2U5L6_9BACT|nr:MAG: hypothetical protein A2653_02670 [Candidatus Zambryskibacteria bacterium RIFCSPHIGHO2_01_FULL_43_25]OHB01179.1 MAG: hypothetical protein A3E94_03030 [Candidatus Zambryskibacteria bacterium RIFCSPHIGHO2_12_FULL_44_12b]OHB04754.1 MAG: hypothetical protein A3B14_03820 [Candidatus Zambryskibacteria bacterium RIFCSPLOWO2_01_FULL_45_21]
MPAEKLGSPNGHVIYPWQYNGDLGEWLLGPTVSEILQRALELFPGVSLDKIRLTAEPCCTHIDTKCHRVNIGLISKEEVKREPERES